MSDIKKVHYYYADNFDPWWCYQLHNEIGIQRGVDKQPNELVEVMDFKEWPDKWGSITISPDMSTLSINGDSNENLPVYIKVVVDDDNILYFYRLKVATLNNLQPNYSVTYLCDDWMTRFAIFHKIAYDKKLATHFITKFEDEMQYIKGDPYDSVMVDFWACPWFYYFVDQAIPPIKEESWYTNAEELRDINNISDMWDQYDVLTKNNTYMVILCNSTALTKVIQITQEEGTTTWKVPYSINQGNNKLLYIPITSPKMIEAFQKIDLGYSIDTTNWDPSDFSDINPLGPAFMKAYTTMLPPSVVIGCAFNQYGDDSDKVEFLTRKIHYRINDGDPTDPKNYDIMDVDCLAIDSTLGIDFILRHFEVTQLGTYRDSIGSRLFRFLETYDYERDEHNSLICCQPKYFYESIKLDDSYEITWSFGDFKFSQDYEAILENFDINCRVAFNYGETIIYNFGINTNEKNVDYNNTATNKRFTNPWEINIFGSASATLFAQGPTSAWMGTANKNADQKLQKQNYIMDVEQQTVNYATQVANDVADALSEAGDGQWYNPVSYAKVGASATRLVANTVKHANDYAVEMSRTVLTQEYNVAKQNRAFASTFSNQLSQPAQGVTTPYIGSYSVVPLDDKGKPKLFRTFLYHAPYFELRRKLEETWANGMKVNMIYYEDQGGYSAYKNRALFNVIKVNPNYNINEWIKELRAELPDKWLFNSDAYAIDFLTYIGSGVILESGWNITPQSQWKYNVELSVPNFDHPKLSVRKLLSNYNIKLNNREHDPITFDDIKTAIEKINNPPTFGWDRFWQDVDNDFTPPTKSGIYTIKLTAKDDSQILRGTRFIYLTYTHLIELSTILTITDLGSFTSPYPPSEKRIKEKIQELNPIIPSEGWDAFWLSGFIFDVSETSVIISPSENNNKYKGTITMTITKKEFPAKPNYAQLYNRTTNTLIAEGQLPFTTPTISTQGSYDLLINPDSNIFYNTQTLVTIPTGSTSDSSYYIYLPDEATINLTQQASANDCFIKINATNSRCYLDRNFTISKAGTLFLIVNSAPYLYIPPNFTINNSAQTYPFRVSTGWTYFWDADHKY